MNIQAQLGRAALAAALAVGISAGASAAPLAVVNHSFEDTTGQVVFNEFTFGAPVGWAIYDPNGIVDQATVFTGTLDVQPPAFFPGGAPDGDRIAIAFGFSGTGDTGEYGYQQTLGDVLTANTHYELQVEVGNIASGTDTGGNPYDLSGFPGYRIELLAGTDVIAVDDNTLGGIIPEGDFLTATLTVDIGAAHTNLGQALGIRLVNLNLAPEIGSPDLEVDFDNVRLDATPVPEPMGLFGGLLLLIGLGCAALRHRAAAQLRRLVTI
jgi:hypothetical protein